MIKPDEVVRAGPIVFRRYGKYTSAQNLMSQEQVEAFIKSLAEAVPQTAKEIDNHIERIGQLVSSFHPLRLMHCAFFNLAGAIANKPSEIEHGREEGNTVRVVEYIQTIITSTPANSIPADGDFDMTRWRQLREEIASLYDKLRLFLFERSAARRLNDANYDEEFDKFYVQAQALWLDVRGERHQFHDIPHLRDFLTPHDDAFNTLFGISVEQFLIGLTKLEFSLSQGLGKTLEEMKELQRTATDAVDQRLKEAEAQKSPLAVLEEVLTENGWREWAKSIMGRFEGFDLFDVQKVTGLPVSLLDELSWKPGQETEFFASGEFAGWPLRMLPIHKRPFLQLDGRYYCFNLWSVMDNIYRIMQRTVIRSKPDYKEVWNQRQKEVSEDVPFRLFSKLAPSAVVYKPVFYLAPNDATGRDEWCEADGLIVLDDHLIVVEVKAGAFAVAPPTTDFDSYIKSVERLILAPASQASRFLRHLGSAQEINVYDKEHVFVARLRRDHFRHATACCVTLDSLTDLGARTQHLKPLGVDVANIPIWALSIDDLRVYADIFDSSITFAHFLEQRQLAAKASFLDLNDELDHLGLYMAHNMYVMHAEELSRNAKMGWVGYRKDIDIYFSKLAFAPEEATRPGQAIPSRLSEILKMLDQQNKFGRCHAGACLINLDSTTRNKVATGIDHALRRQVEIGHAAPFMLAGEAKLTLFCCQPGIEAPNISEMRDYALCSVLLGKETERLLLVLQFDSTDVLRDVDFQFLYPAHITEERRVELEKLAKYYGGTRLETHIKHHGKIGRNERCPCGSGKKFKKCCGHA